MCTQFFSLDSYRRRIRVLERSFFPPMCKEQSKKTKTALHLYENILLKYTFFFLLSLPLSSYSGTSWPKQYYSMTILTGRHSISLDILFYFDLGMGPGSLLLILSLENISYCFCQTVSRVGVFITQCNYPWKNKWTK